MSIDFTNRWAPDGQNARDPNAVVSVTPAKSEWWIKTDKDGVWQGAPTNDSTVSGQPGYRSVGTATVLLADGREFRAVLNGQGEPLSEVGDQLAPSDAGTKQRATFTQQTNATTPNSGSPTQKRTGPDGLDHIYQWNPQTRQYDTDLGGVQGVGPPGGKPYLDDGVEAGQSGRRWGWNQQTHAYDRDLGPSPAAQLPQTAGDRKPVEGRPGYSIVSTKNAQTNQTETHYEKDDNPGVAVQLPGDTKNESITYRKNAQGQLEKVTTTTANGAKSESVAPVLPSERTQVGTKTSTANGRTVKTTTWQLPDGSQIDTTDEASTSEGAPIPAGAPTYTPVYGTDDLGLSDYDKALRQAVSDQIITVDQGRKLMETASGLATEAHVHGATLRSEAATGRGQDITQRGQDIGEVQSRRSAANDMFSGLYKSYDAGAQKLMGGDEGLATQAFLTSLKLAPANAQAWGGMAAVPQVGPAYQQAAGGPSVTVHPSGAVQVQHPAPVGAAVGPVAAGVTATNAAAVDPTGANVQAATDATMAGSAAAFQGAGVPPSPAPNAPVGMVPGGQRPAFAPDLNALQAQGFSAQEIAQAHQEMMDEGLYAA
jgi:hypothetical protein